jgi:hypothetical protein
MRRSGGSEGAGCTGRESGAGSGEQGRNEAATKSRLSSILGGLRQLVDESTRLRSQSEDSVICVFEVDPQ